MSQFVWTFPGGKLHQEVTSITLVNATTLTEDVVVPAGKMWILLNIKMVNCDDVNRALYVEKYLEAAATNLIKRLISKASAAGDRVNWPSVISATEYSMPTQGGNPWELCAAGNLLRCVYETGGASTGATDADGLVIEYLEIDEP